MATAPAPLINSFRYDWSSITIRAFGVSLPNSFTKISYAVEKDGRAHMYGKGPDPIGQTRGRNKPECSWTMPKSDFNHLVSLMPANTPIGNNFFDVVVSYDDEGQIITDQVLGLTITKVEDEPEQGGDAAMVNVTALPTRIVYNGRDF